MLLLGLEIKFICGEGEHIITIESLGQGKQTKPLISYGQEVDAKCSSQSPCSRQFYGKAKFLQPKNEFKDFPFSGDIVKVVLFSPTKSGNNNKKEM